MKIRVSDGWPHQVMDFFGGGFLCMWWKYFRAVFLLSSDRLWKIIISGMSPPEKVLTPLSMITFKKNSFLKSNHGIFFVTAPWSFYYLYRDFWQFLSRSMFDLCFIFEVFFLLVIHTRIQLYEKKPFSMQR